MWPAIKRSQLEFIVGVIMRVPGLIIIDYWWQNERNKSLPQSVNTKDIMNAVITNLVLVHGFLLLLLPLPRVKALYTHFVSFVLLFTAHMISTFYVHLEYQTADPYFLTLQLTLLIMHLSVAAISNVLLNGSGKPNPIVLAAFSVPVMCRLFGLSVSSVEFAHSFADSLIGLSMLRYMYRQLPHILECVKDAYEDAMLVTEANGWMALLVVLWNKLFVPNYFLVFWLVQFSLNFTAYLWHPYRYQTLVWGDEWYTITLGLVSTVCASPVSLIATSVTVSYMSYFVLRVTKSYLSWELSLANDSPLYSGWTEGLTLVLFALQTGLIEMKMPARMAVMTVILFIDLSTLLQSMLDITEPVVLSLSASKSKNLMKHVRAFSMCAFLFFFPLYLTYSLSLAFALDFWMIVLLSSCVLTSFQVLDLLVVHGLFIYDSSRSEPWEILDEVVYYTRAVTKVVEFLVAVLVVAVGLLESPMGKFSWANSSIILIHCYFNVWQRLQAGWRSFLLRREAVQKITSLQSASPEQLSARNDLCAICFVDMKSACVTPCSHFFHRTCLKKWLYIQDTCPLCHASINVVPSSSNKPPETTAAE